MTNLYTVVIDPACLVSLYGRSGKMVRNVSVIHCGMILSVHGSTDIAGESPYFFCTHDQHHQQSETGQRVRPV